MRYLLASFFLSLLLSCQSSKTDYNAFKNAQDYTIPLWNPDAFSGRQVALFIFPHPDDEIICGGSIALLKQQGWEVDLVTLTQGNSEEKETRKAEWTTAVSQLGIDGHTLLDIPNNTWEAVQKNELVFWNEQQDSVEHILLGEINKYQPTLLFTYDDILGGYGHPEHRITAAVAKKIFEQYKMDSNFSPKAIYQVSLSKNMESLVVGPLDSYKKAIAATGKTLPPPTIAFDITKAWPVKRRAAAAYSSQLKTLRKFYQVPEEKDTAIHYSTFDREYYFAITR